MVSASKFESFIKFVLTPTLRGKFHFWSTCQLKTSIRFFTTFCTSFQTANLCYFHFLHSRRSYATQLEKWPLSRSISEISLLAASIITRNNISAMCIGAASFARFFCHTGDTSCARLRCNYATAHGEKCFQWESETQWKRPSTSCERRYIASSRGRRRATGARAHSAAAAVCICFTIIGELEQRLWDMETKVERRRKWFSNRRAVPCVTCPKDWIYCFFQCAKSCAGELRIMLSNQQRLCN